MKVADISEHQLVANAKAGDQAAFSHLVVAYQDRVFNALYRMFGNYDEAEELAQETFVRAYESLGRFRGEASFYTWVFRIAMNTGKSRIRRADFRNKPVSLDGSFGDEETSLKHQIAGDSPSPSEGVEQDERAEIIKKALDSMSQDARTIVVLRDIEGYDYKDIASLLELDLGTVKSRLHRARLQLAELLGDDFI